MLFSKLMLFCEHHSRLEGACSLSLLIWLLAEACLLARQGLPFATSPGGGERRANSFAVWMEGPELHGIPSVRICSLPGWLVQKCPYVLQTLSKTLDDLDTHRFVVLAFWDTYIFQRVCILLLLREDVLVFLVKSCWALDGNLPNNPPNKSLQRQIAIIINDNISLFLFIMGGPNISH